MNDLSPIKAAPAYHLNQGQEAAAEAFLQFLLTPQKEFIISGPAGTGKTYLMNYIIDQTMPNYHNLCKMLGIDPLYTGVEMTATTNKAAEVLGESTGRPTSTIHSFLGLTVFEDYATGHVKLKRTQRWQVHENKIIFIDECSMIDNELYKTLQEATLNCKIVYVGDHSQLAPVTEKLSPIYKPETPFYALTEQMRNAGQPALQALCQQLRETVETDLFLPVREVPGVIDHLNDDEMQAELARIFQTQTKDARILAYTNRRVSEFNAFIRDMRALPDEYMVGELLVCNAVYEKGRKRLAVEEEIEVTRSSGPDQIEIDTNPDGSKVLLDVHYYDIESALNGTFPMVPVPTNREHFDALVRHYKARKNWERYFHLKNTYPDLRPRDAATVHKSQGSTYDTVFVDLGNISTCTNRDQAARMLYVAFSRAKNRVCLFGNLTERFGGLVLS